ncbi:hypothetical protein [Streptomyces sp. H51]|uniref:hypothetical protein n=1 Tax=Streptomyces sp. H51 TaxID=3111770 RepID=UPI002D7755A1|nr:hypothetical protein [Streptomyces sp. H51]
MRTYPRIDGPALQVWSAGKWRWAPVLARQDWADGRVFYQVSVDLTGSTTVTIRLYEWPQPGLRAAPQPTPGTGSGDTTQTPPTGPA